MVDAERRSTKRVRTRSLVANASLGNKRVITAIDNLSLGGAFLRTSQLLEVGSRIGLELFETGNKQPLVLIGRVVSRITPDAAAKRRVLSGMGIEFDGRTVEQSRRLAALIEGLEVAPAPRGARPATQQGWVVTPAPRAASGEIKRRLNRRVEAKDATANVRMNGEVIALAVPVHNVSLGGLFLVSPDPLALGAGLGAALEIEVTFAGRSLVAAATVAGVVTPHSSATRNIPAGIAARFTPMSRATAKRLRTLIAAIVPSAADGLTTEQPVAGYLPEPVDVVTQREDADAPAQPVGQPPQASKFGFFDFNAVDLGADPNLAHAHEDLPTELARLKAEIKTRQDRIEVIEQLLATDDEPLGR